MLGTIAVLLLVLLKGRQIGELVPLNFADLFPGAWLEVGILRDASENIQLHMLFSHCDVNALHVFLCLAPGQLQRYRIPSLRRLL